jgi:acyl-coenzyme A thioesterase PaaI-like protein
VTDRPPFDASDLELSPRLLAARDGEVSPRRTGLRRVAAATRVLIEGLVGTDADDATIAATADALERLAAAFDRDGPRSIYDGIAEVAMAGADPSALFEHSPFIGRANPLSPPITLSVVDDVVIGTARFGSAYEGPPGCVHGGYVAAAFDEVLGSAQTFSGSPGMTGTLTIRYRRPTPLHADLRFEGRMVGREGRKVFTEGKVFAGDVLTAEAEGLFISIDVEKFRALREARDARLRPGSGPAGG